MRRWPRMPAVNAEAFRTQASGPVRFLPPSSRPPGRANSAPLTGRHSGHSLPHERDTGAPKSRASGISPSGDLGQPTLAPPPRDGSHPRPDGGMLSLKRAFGGGGGSIPGPALLRVQSREPSLSISAASLGLPGAGRTPPAPPGDPSVPAVHPGAAGASSPASLPGAARRKSHRAGPSDPACVFPVSGGGALPKTDPYRASFPHRRRRGPSSWNRHLSETLTAASAPAFHPVSQGPGSRPTGACLLASVSSNRGC